MVSVSQVPTDALRRVQRVQAITIVWMSVEAAISLLAAWRAKSPALLAFGGDSAIELLSAVVVLWRFGVNAVQEHAERRAARIAGVLLFALAACVVTASVMALRGYSEPKPTLLGIAILVAATVFMPLLAMEKRRLSALTGSAALRADAAESAVCGYLSLIALVGLVLNAVWHVAWADSAAALAIVPLVLWEGREALRGKTCTGSSQQSLNLIGTGSAANAVVAVGKVQAQTMTFKANVPFPFVVGNQTLPPAEADEVGMIVLRSNDPQVYIYKAVVTSLEPQPIDSPTTSTLVFALHSGQRYLSGVRIGGEKGHHIHYGPSESELAKIDGSPEEVALAELR